MACHGKAYFVARPRVIGDLQTLHLVEREQEYQIVKTKELRKIDYENFITDMLADRPFIEADAHLCGRTEIRSCLLVRQYDRTDGVLVVPGDSGHVAWAAYVCHLSTAHPRA